jgi:hypothetical protein
MIIVASGPGRPSFCWWGRGPGYLPHPPAGKNKKSTVWGRRLSRYLAIVRQQVKLRGFCFERMGTNDRVDRVPQKGADAHVCQGHASAPVPTSTRIGCKTETGWDTRRKCLGVDFKHGKLEQRAARPAGTAAKKAPLSANFCQCQLPRRIWRLRQGSIRFRVVVIELLQRAGRVYLLHKGCCPQCFDTRDQPRAYHCGTSFLPRVLLLLLLRAS